MSVDRSGFRGAAKARFGPSPPGFENREANGMVYHGVQVPMDGIGELCRQHHIRRLALFGSILTDTFRSDSDVDVLVEFEPGKTPGLSFFDIQDELSRLIGRPVDLNTPRDLSRYFRDEILAEAQTLYVQE